MGEVRAIKPLIKEFEEESNISVITNTGFDEAKTICKNVRFLPFEIFLPFWITRQKVLVVMELTRRMTIARNCFNRVAGAYMDEEGFIDGSFNTHFLKLSPADKEKQLAIAKTIPYAKTNEQLKNFRIDSRQKKPGSIWHLLTALRDCELKNDALLYSLYEYIGERYVVDKPYTIEVFCGNYDVPVKGADKENQWESEEVYRFLVVAVCPTVGEYEAGMPQAGFLFPAFANRSTDLEGVNIFAEDGACEKLANMLGL
jgi:hypothetical protein